MPRLAKDPTDSNLVDQDQILQVLLTITAVYLLIMEVSSIMVASLSYFKDLTRLFNFLTPVLLLTNVYNNDARGDVYYWNIQMFTALCIWFRFLLYLRTRKRFSWLIRMITECVKDMFYFLIIFFIGVVAFADAFLSIDAKISIKAGTETESEEDQDFYEKYLYEYVEAVKYSFFAALGNIDLELNYDNVDWLIIVFLCIFNIIVLLNLLIAIISETFSNISES